MDLALIEKLMRMLEQSSLQELDVNDGGTRIRIAKKRSMGLDAPGPGPVEVTEVAEPEAEGPHRIISGMTGTFYRSSAPGVAPYVVEGSKVEDGQRLALVEAMKVFNPVESDVAGTIIRILAEDGASVYPGMALFEVETE